MHRVEKQTVRLCRNLPTTPPLSHIPSSANSLTKLGGQSIFLKAVSQRVFSLLPSHVVERTQHRCKTSWSVKPAACLCADARDRCSDVRACETMSFHEFCMFQIAPVLLGNVWSWQSTTSRLTESCFLLLSSPNSQLLWSCTWSSLLLPVKELLLHSHRHFPAMHRSCLTFKLYVSHLVDMETENDKVTHCASSCLENVSLWPNICLFEVPAIT